MSQQQTTKKVYPPTLKVAYEKGEPDGPRKVKTVPKQREDANGNWVDRDDGSVKQEATAVNLSHVVMPYADAYKKDGKFPVVNFGKGPMVSISWRMYLVGPAAVDEDGDKLTKMPLPTEVSWSDRTTDAWMYDRMSNEIEKALNSHPGSNIRDHVFEFGKKAGPSPNGTFHFRHLGLLKNLYPNITIPAPTSSGAGNTGEKRQRPSGPSAKVLASMPEGVQLPKRQNTDQEAQAAAAPVPNPFTPTAPVVAAPAVPSGFEVSPTAKRIADLLVGHLASQGTTLVDVCNSRNIKPEVMLYNAFVMGGAKDPSTGEVLKIPTAEAEIISKNPSLVGIQL